MPAHIARYAMAGDAADARGNFLDRHHQRKRQQHGPADAVAELRAGLAVGADARRIVVGRAGDQPGAERLQRIAEAKRLGGLGLDRPAWRGPEPMLACVSNSVCDLPCQSPAAATTSADRRRFLTGTCRRPRRDKRCRHQAGYVGSSCARSACSTPRGGSPDKCRAPPERCRAGRETRHARRARGRRTACRAAASGNDRRSRRSRHRPSADETRADRPGSIRRARGTRTRRAAARSARCR